jgi:hypothetical protein
MDHFFLRRVTHLPFNAISPTLILVFKFAAYSSLDILLLDTHVYWTIAGVAYFSAF